MITSFNITKKTNTSNEILIFLDSRACFYLNCNTQKCYAFGIPETANADSEKCEENAVPWICFNFGHVVGEVFPAASHNCSVAEYVIMPKPIPQWVTKSKFLSRFSNVDPTRM